jgi:transposase
VKLQGFSGDRMDVHKNAHHAPRGRDHFVRLVLSGQSPEAAARAVGVCPRTVRKWVKRYRDEGPAGLLDRSSRPHRLYRLTPETVVQRICELRRQRWTGKQIAVETGVSPATVSRVLKRHGLNRLRSLAPAEPVRRYERAHSGELLHIDIKKLGRFERVGHRITGDRRCGETRGAGWEFVHVAIDDASRLAFFRHPADVVLATSPAFEVTVFHSTSAHLPCPTH